MIEDPRQQHKVGAISQAGQLPPAPVTTPGRTTLADGAQQGTPPLFGDPLPQWEAIGEGETGKPGTSAVVPHTRKPAKASKPAAALGGYEALLLEALTHGDVPVAEFENYARQMEEKDLAALLQRLMIDPPPSTDKLASAFYQRVPSADRIRITSWLRSTVKAHADARMWSELAPGEQTTSVNLISRVDAFAGVYLRSQPAGAKDGPLLPFGAIVAVSQKTEKGWYYVTVLEEPYVEGETPPASPVGAKGFVESYHIASQMPEPRAKLHKVGSGELLKDIAAKYYRHGKPWSHDARVYVQAIYHANKGRDVVFRQKADLSVNEEALNTTSLDRALELWEQARVVNGQALWMPSSAFVHELLMAGVINKASISGAIWDATVGAAVGAIAEAWSFLKYTAGFLIGILEGAWGALEDLFKGAVDLVKMIWTVIKDIFNNFSEIKAFAKKISAAWKNRDAIIQEIATQFMGKWENPDDYARGNFQGEFLGYVMMTALITLVTFGAGTAVVGAGRFGAFIKLIQFADKAGSIGTYVNKLKTTVKLPKRAVDKSRDALKTTKLGADVDGPNGDAPHIDGPKVDTPHAHRGPQQNKGGPYIDSTSNHPDANDAPHAHLDKLPKIKDDIVTKWDKLTQALNRGKKGVPVGRKLKTADEGHAILQRLARGDETALADLGLKDVPKGYNTMGREWALVEGKNGFFLYAGRYADVELPNGARVHAHNHPDPHASAPIDATQKPTIDLPAPFEGKTFTELLQDTDALAKSGLAPSVADIHAISDGGAHVIYTRFAHRGGGKIANPVAGEAAPRVAIHLAGTKVVRYDPRTKQYFYQTSVELRDATGKKLWSGEMYAQWYAQTRNGVMHYRRPPQLDRDLPRGWIDP